MGDPGRRCSTCGRVYPADVMFCPGDGTPLSLRSLDSGPDPYKGQVLAGQFRLDALLGAGAMGRVYRAEQLGVERAVAVKLMHRDLAANNALVGRFRREARVLGSLRHPNLVEVLMLAEHDDAGLRVPFMALEYLDGMSLRSALAAQGALPLGRAQHLALQLSDAVGQAHQLGIVHRDLKPENLMLVQRGDDADFVKVLDFGVARVDDAKPSIATQAGSIFGSARYVSPEGAAGEQPGPAGDVYAIATILYECLAGKTPFEDASAVQVLVKQQSAVPAPLASQPRARDIPVEIAALVDRNLAKAPGERAADARTFGRALLATAKQAGLDADELLPHPTLLGTRAGRAVQSGTARGYRPLAAAAAREFDEAATTRVSGAAPELMTDAPPRAAPRRRVGAQRALVVLLCFVLGAGAALGIATRLGAFAARSTPGTAP
jgi:serine/threonine-protein kinase